MPKKDRHRADGELFSLDIPSYRTFRRERSKARHPCEITLSDRSSPHSLAMYIPFGTWPTPQIWSRWNGVLTLCTKELLAKSRLRAKRFRFLAVPSTSMTSGPERFRQEE